MVVYKSHSQLTSVTTFQIDHKPLFNLQLRSEIEVRGMLKLSLVPYNTGNPINPLQQESELSSQKAEQFIQNLSPRPYLDEPTYYPN